MTPTPVAYRDELARSTARSRALLAETDLDAPAPTCPGWSVRDLLLHLGRTQAFWARVLAEGWTEEPPEPDLPPPTGRDGLLALLDVSHRDLLLQLETLDPAEPRWTWSEDRTVGFTLRRQAHEALVHRWDAEAAAGAGRMPVPAALAADGVDEVLRVMLGGTPSWAAFTPAPHGPVVLRATDADRSWAVQLGRCAGTAPSGTAHDLAVLEVLDPTSGTARPAATLSGTAEDLDAWLWGRPLRGGLRTDGAAAPLALLDELRTEGIG